MSDYWHQVAEKFELQRNELSERLKRAEARAAKLETFIKQVMVARGTAGCSELSCGAANEFIIGDAIDNSEDVDLWPFDEDEEKQG